MTQRQDIQVLRGLAVLFVLLFHANLTGMKAGYLGNGTPIYLDRNHFSVQGSRLVVKTYNLVDYLGASAP